MASPWRCTEDWHVSSFGGSAGSSVTKHWLLSVALADKQTTLQGVSSHDHGMATGGLNPFKAVISGLDNLYNLGRLNPCKPV
jgi:hypothetical protein